MRMFQSRNRETFDFNSVFYTHCPPFFVPFQSRNRETFDFNSGMFGIALKSSLFHVSIS